MYARQQIRHVAHRVVLVADMRDHHRIGMAVHQQYIEPREQLLDERILRFRMALNINELQLPAFLDGKYVLL